MKRLKEWFLKANQAITDCRSLDCFTRAMDAKLAKSRKKGRGGWIDKSQVSDAELAKQLIEHVAKGDPVDVANFCMFLHQRGASPMILSQALQNHVVTEVVPYIRELTSANKG